MATSLIWLIPLTWRQVVVDDVVRHVPHEDHLEAGEAVVAQRAADKDPVLLVQLPNLDPVVQNDRPGVGLE